MVSFREIGVYISRGVLGRDEDNFPTLGDKKEGIIYGEVVIVATCVTDAQF